MRDFALDYALTRHDAPTVVLVHGLGATFQKSWRKVYPEVALGHTVLAYNRAGYGRTPVHDAVRDARQIVSELRKNLQRLALSPPYVLVGHSMGGLYMQWFARQHPQDVAGLLLVDSTHPRQFEGDGAPGLQPLWFQAGFHLFLRCFGGLREWESARLSGEQVLDSPLLPEEIPVIALLSGQPEEHEEMSPLLKHDRAMKMDFAHLYPGCELEWLDCGHDIPVERPQAVIDAIDRICRSGGIRR